MTNNLSKGEIDMKKIARIFAVLLVIATMISLAVPATAAEPRYATNGYTSSDIVYNGKTYTISVGVGGLTTYAVVATATCYVAGIQISLPGITAKFDTINYGYITNTGSPRTGTTSTSSFSVTTAPLYCSKGTSQVIRVLTVSGSATFYGVNNGQNTTLSVRYAV